MIIYQNKHMKRNNNMTKGKRFKKNKERLINFKLLILTTILILCLIISSSIAYLIKKNGLNNLFLIGRVDAIVNEEYNAENNIKNNIYITNKGNTDGYVRVAIIVVLKNNDGKILGVRPKENVDYTIQKNLSSNWIEGKDGYYYYIKPLKPNENTDNLIDEFKQIRTIDNATLELNIACQIIQAIPKKAVEESWNVQILNNLIAIKE